MKKRQGYAAISRAIQDNFLWLAEPFTKAQAWIDLILYANWKDTQELDRGEVIKLYRGQFYASDGFWVERWQWSRNKVRSYFALLAKEGMIKRTTSRRRTIYTIIKYNDYQPSFESDGTTEGTTESTTKGTTESISESTTKGTSKGTQHKKDKKKNSIKREKIDDVNNDNEAIFAREEDEDKLDIDEEVLLKDVFGEVNDFTRTEYIELEKKYGWARVQPALKKTQLMGGETINYTKKILEENCAVSA